MSAIKATVRKRKSEIWKYFEIIEGTSAASCNICKQKFSFKTTVSNLKKHAEKKHAAIYSRPTEALQSVHVIESGKDDHAAYCEVSPIDIMVNSTNPNNDGSSIRIMEISTVNSIYRPDYRMSRHYQGKIKAVIVDWAGTVIDCGVFAPSKTFTEIFFNEGIEISDEEARGPMGTHKRVHIEQILDMDSVRKRWINKHGKPPTVEDIDRMYNSFIPLQIESLKTHSEMIEGAVDTLYYLRNNMGLKIGSTTGYPNAILNVLKVVAAQAGFTPDCYVAGDDVPQARPCPYMVWLNAIKMDVHPVEAIVKVDDTVDGVREGLSAGCWSVGVAKTSNYMAASELQMKIMEAEEYQRKLKRSYDTLTNSGAHYVIDSIVDLPQVINDINLRLEKGEKP